jgi:hypothetical protein
MSSENQSIENNEYRGMTEREIYLSRQIQFLTKRIELLTQQLVTMNNAKPIQFAACVKCRELFR